MKKNSKVEDIVEKLISPILEEAGYSLYDVSYVKESQDWYLRVFINSDSGIELVDCEKVNHLINGPLDELDPIPQAYFLEISSPGIERVLNKPQHYMDSIGSKIHVKLYKPINKMKEFDGILKEVDVNGITLEYNDNIMKLCFIDIAKANISVF